MSDGILIKSKVKQNSQILDLFPTVSLIKAWEWTTGKNIATVVSDTARWGADYASVVLDVNTVVKLINDLGINGKVIAKTVNGRQYIIFKGYSGIRSIFTASRYLATNPKVVDMSIGTIGVNRSILSGARLTIFLVVPLNILTHFLHDQKSISLLIGKTATDLVKVGAASALASLAATATATVTTLAAGPIIVAIVVGVATTLALDALDKKYGVTDALVREIDKAYDNTIGEFGRQMNQVERRLRWQIINGQPVGRGIFY
nr:hypothetical protein [uncultured Desulfobacter sp.]